MAGQTGEELVVAPSFAAAVTTIAERAAEHDRDATFPHEAFDLLFAAGVLNLTLPVAMGGGGGGLVAACRVTEAVGWADPAVALVLSQHYLYHSAVASPSSPWPDHLRERVQRSSLEAVALANFLRVEPELGTPARGGLPATVAHRKADGSGWRLEGRKIYCTGIPRLRWLLVFARSDDADPLVGTWLVEAGTPGYRVEATWDHLGMRATRSDDVVFEGCEVPLDHAADVRPASAGAAVADPELMAWNSLLIGAVYLGVARAARDWLAGYLHERVPSGLGKPLATLARFQEAMGRIEAKVQTSAQLLTFTAAAVDRGERGAGEASGLVKQTVTTNAIDAVGEAVALVGNPGLARRNPLERHLRNVLCSRIHTPQDDMALLNAGRSVLAAADPLGKDGRGSQG